VGKVFAEIDGKLEAWIRRQRLFFVGTAPSGGDGHVNVSPKGPIETLKVLGPRELAYLDLVGSGAETLAHLRENGRIVVMLCDFEGPPRIVRLHGRGEVLQRGCEAFDALVHRLDFEDVAAWDVGSRSIVRIDVTRVADSCGYGVPLMDYAGERPQRTDWVDRKLGQGGPDALLDYMVEKNTASVDGLPAVDEALLRRTG
jgi:hypothetical protein